jgi:hypothetical protein
MICDVEDSKDVYIILIIIIIIGGFPKRHDMFYLGESGESKQDFVPAETTTVASVSSLQKRIISILEQ